MGQPKVSVILPVHNVEQYLPECLESVINQTLRDIEIICVNGGSTDGSLCILQEYAAKDERIRIITHGDVGLGANMNTGIDAARGEFIGIVETDDYILPRMYETLYREAKKSYVDFVKSDYEIFVDEGEIRKFEYQPICPSKDDYGKIWDPQTEQKVFSFAMPNWTGIFRTAFLRENKVRFNETPGASYQDNSFWFLSFAAASRVKFVNKAFYMLRRDNPNSSVNSKEKVYCICEAYDYIRAYLERDQERLKRFVYVYQYYKFGNYTYNLNRVAYRYKYEFLQRFSREFSEARDRGELCEDVFLPHQWRDINYIIDDMDGYFRTYYYNIEEEQRLCGQISSKDEQLKMALQEIEAIHASASYRIGRLITWFPRLLRRIFRYVRMNGLAFSVRRFFQKTVKQVHHENRPRQIRAPLPPLQNGKPRVSVVLAVKNGEKYLEEAMQSILRQSLQEIELICVYDESVDRTLEILEEYAAQDDRISIIYGNKTGPGGARNVGLEYINGEYLIFLDGDDIFELSMLEEMYRMALREKAEITVCQSESLDEATGKCTPINDSINLSMIPNQTVFQCMDCPDVFFRAFIGWAWDKLIKTSFVRENNLRFGDYYVCEDAAFVIPAMIRASRIAVLRTTMVHHRASSDSLEGTPEHFKKHWQDAHITFAYIAARMREWNLYDTLRVGYLNWVVHFSLWLLDHTVDEAHNELLIDLKNHIWPELGVDQLSERDFLYREEWNAFSSIRGNAPDVSRSDTITITDWEAKYEQLRQDFDAMRNGMSFRLGRVITWFPRKIRGGIRCWREHGLIYTIKRFLVKLQRIGGNGAR